MLLTYHPHCWDSELKSNTTSVVKQVLDYIVDRVDQEHTRYVVASNIEMCTKLAAEIVNEIVEFIVMGGDAMLSDSTSSAEKTTHLTCIDTKKCSPSQELTVRNLAVELEEVDHAENPDVVHDVMDAGSNEHSQMEPSFCSVIPSTNEISTEFEELWTKRKLDVEKSAEGKARVVFRQWQRDRLTLTQAIDESLREYADMYEKAHALRLMFEEEKSQWSCQVMRVHAEDTPYGYSGDSKRRRCDTEWAPPQPSWPYPQRQSLDSEFQYTVEESQDFDDRSELPARGATRAPDGNNVISPQKKTFKKFTVPVKHAQEEV